MVLDPCFLVYPLVNRWLDLVAGLVGMVGMVMVVIAMDFLAVLVDYTLQRIDYLAMERPRAKNRLAGIEV